VLVLVVPSTGADVLEDALTARGYHHARRVLS
jgi:hypothetical protein